MISIQWPQKKSSTPVVGKPLSIFNRDDDEIVTIEDIAKTALPTKRVYYPVEQALKHRDVGNQLALNQRYDEAALAFSKAMAADPSLKYLYAESASQIFLIKGDYFKAILLGKRSIAHKEDYGEAHRTLARALFNFGELDDAIHHMQKAALLGCNVAEELEEYGGVKKRVDDSLANARPCVVVNGRINGSMRFYESGIIVDHSEDEIFHEILKKKRWRPLCCQRARPVG